MDGALASNFGTHTHAGDNWVATIKLPHGVINAITTYHHTPH